MDELRAAIRTGFGNKYNIDRLELLGNGGSASVYKIRDDNLSIEYALKVDKQGFDAIDTSEFNEIKSDFIKEIKACNEAAVISKYVARILDYAVVPRMNNRNKIVGYYVFMVMDKMESLADNLNKYLGDERAVLKIADNILQALEACKRKNIVHRDIKPGNILVSRRDGKEEFLLSDFGVSKFISNGSYAYTQVSSGFYTAPEPNKSFAADIYSLGITMYVLMNNGLPPFAGRKRDDVSEQLMRDIKKPSPKNASDGLSEIILKACEFKVINRYKSAEEMLLAVQKYNGCFVDVEYIQEDVYPRDEQSVLERASHDLVKGAKDFFRNKFGSSGQKTVKRKSSEAKQQSQKPRSAQASYQTSGPKGSVSSVKQRPVTPPSPAPSNRSYEPKSAPVSKTIQQRRTASSMSKLNVEVGDKIKFGRYPQGANGEIAPIEWRVLVIQGSKALLLTDKLLDYVRYNEKFEEVTWETCTLRKWMNNQFMKKAFSRDEQSKIATVINENPKNRKTGIGGGRPTQDKVFALSIDEAKVYFSSDEDRIAYTTDYAHNEGHDNSNRSGYWWLRSPGDCNKWAADVGTGGIHAYGCGVKFDNVAVRPAFWLNL